MADKRTFSRSFLLRSLFKELSPPAQQLYMILNYEADNAGFVKTPDYIARSSGYSEKDLTELMEKGYLLQVDPDVVLLAHWYRNNHIRKERRGRTAFADLLQLVTLEQDIYRLNAAAEKQKASESKSPPNKFVKPSIEEVRAFIQEKGFHVDADAWYAHYESNGWMVGKNKMKSWQASVNYWEQNNKKGAFTNGSTKGSSTVVIGDTGSEYGQSPFFPYQPQWYGGNTLLPPEEWTS